MWSRTIQSELRGYLNERSITSDRRLRARNLEIILFLYGLGSSSWPTYEEAGERWELKRQRIEQIKSRDFEIEGAFSNLPSLQHFLSVLMKSRCWLQSSLMRTLLSTGLAENNFSIRGLLNLIKDSGGRGDYDIYTPTFKVATRHTMDKFEDYLVMSKDCLDAAVTVRRQARRFHRKYGMARLVDLFASLNTPDDPEIVRAIEHALRLSEEGWMEEIDGRQWYLFEDQKHVLRNYSDKVFSVVDACDIDELTTVYKKSLHQRKQDYDFPTEDVVRRYFQTSRAYSVTGSVVRYCYEASGGLNPIERDVVRCLKDLEHGTDHATLYGTLKASGHNDNLIERTIYFSPLISTDKKAGRGRYVYSLIGTASHQQGPDVEERYLEYRRRLAALSDTDSSHETTFRREQRILREWLFGGEDSVRCAMCNRLYPVHALVAAHKKDRSGCSHSTRIDPHIVMPLCYFGCDFVYGKRYVVVEGGVIVRGAPLVQGDAVWDYVERLVGTRLDEKWVRGHEWYFQAGVSEGDATNS